MVPLTLVVSCASFMYWNDPRIHNLGNVGVGGGLHAMLAPLSTRIIDHLAYDGVDLRAQVLREHVLSADEDARVVDLCCGVGLSTHGVGVDTSEQMIGVARMRGSGRMGGSGRAGPDTPKTTFHVGNAETWGDADSFDVCTCMFAFHEMPRGARRRVLRNMLRLAPTAVVVDISTSYTPSRAMLWGEPYVLEYQRHVEDDVQRIASAAADGTVEHHVLVEGHAELWKLTR